MQMPPLVDDSEDDEDDVPPPLVDCTGEDEDDADGTSDAALYGPFKSADAKETVGQGEARYEFMTSCWRRGR